MHTRAFLVGIILKSTPTQSAGENKWRKALLVLGFGLFKYIVRAAQIAQHFERKRKENYAQIICITIVH